jgi:hypothetical protein
MNIGQKSDQHEIISFMKIFKAGCAAVSPAQTAFLRWVVFASVVATDVSCNHLGKHCQNSDP